MQKLAIRNKIGAKVLLLNRKNLDQLPFGVLEPAYNLGRTVLDQSRLALTGSLPSVKAQARLMQAKANENDSDRAKERLLISRVQANDFGAVEELYERYSRQAFGLALKILNSAEAAEDAVQDAFLRFWKQPGNFDPERGRFVTWLLSVVHNLCIDQLRRKRHNLLSLDQEETQERLNYLADESATVEEEVWLGMQRSAINHALKHLPTEQRAVIELAFFKGLTHNEIALQTGQPLGTVKSRIRQGLMKLKGLMHDIEAEPVG